MIGYTARNNPDVTWWLEQANRGIEFRKKYAKEPKWDTWRSYYRGNWRDGVLPSNIFFKMIRTIVPRVYFRNPSISLTSTKPGFEGMALSQILERVDNKLLKQMKVKQQMKKITQDAFLFGTGFGKLGFGTEFTPNLGSGIETAAPTDRMNRKVEYNSLVHSNNPWFMRAHPGSIIVPEGLENVEETPWIAQVIRRPADDLQADGRFKHTKDLKGTSILGAQSKAPRSKGSIEMVDLLEVRDKRTGKVIVIPMHEGKEFILFDEDELQIGGQLPIYPIVFNDDDEVFWGVPDAAILEPQQLELNEVRTLEMKHRRMMLAKLLTKRGAITPEEAQKLVSEDVEGVVWIDDEIASAVREINLGGVPPELYNHEEILHRDVRETVGFSRNEFGEYKPGSGDTTATEAQIVKMASEIRVDERRDMLADMLVEVTKGIHQVVFDKWTDDDIVDISGPMGVPIWVKYRGSMLKAGQYEVNIDPDTSIPQTKQAREQKAVQAYGLLKSNPLIEPMKLTKYLLHELHGTAFDDMLRGFPEGVGTQGQPMEMGQLVDFNRRLASAGGGEPGAAA